MEFDDLLGEKALFYGVDNCLFKLDDTIFEAVEDPSDGYRSYLGSVEVKDSDGIFFREPLAIVRVEGDCGGGDEGFKLVDDEVGHIWLRFGTNRDDSYYPCFYFNYQPKPPHLIRKSSLPIRRRYDQHINIDRLFEPRDS